MFLVIVLYRSINEFDKRTSLITFEEFTEAGNELDAACVAVDGARDVETVKVVGISGHQVKESGET